MSVIGRNPLPLGLGTKITNENAKKRETDRLQTFRYKYLKEGFSTPEVVTKLFYNQIGLGRGRTSIYTTQWTCLVPGQRKGRPSIRVAEETGGLHESGFLRKGMEGVDRRRDTTCSKPIP